MPDEQYPISCNTDGVALDGYDMVAYFKTGKPLKGDASWSLEYRDATWYFASAEHRTLFEENPEGYMPAFGGYCVYAIAAGDTTKGAGEHGVLRDGQLYFSVNWMIKRRYMLNPEGYNRKAKVNWTEVQQKIVAEQK